MSKAIRKLNQEMVAGAHNYAAFDRSDPFAFSRAISHIKSGVASAQGGEEAQKNGDHGYYDAEPFKGKRTITHGDTMVEIPVTLYKNVVRP